MDPVLTFSGAERERAGAWKLETTTLPVKARLPARYADKDGSASGPEYDSVCPPSSQPFRPPAHLQGRQYWSEPELVELTRPDPDDVVRHAVALVDTDP